MAIGILLALFIPWEGATGRDDQSGKRACAHGYGEKGIPVQEEKNEMGVTANLWRDSRKQLGNNKKVTMKIWEPVMMIYRGNGGQNVLDGSVPCLFGSDTKRTRILDARPHSGCLEPL
jgi:hypothetical protein